MNNNKRIDLFIRWVKKSVLAVCLFVTIQSFSQSIGSENLTLLKKQVATLPHANQPEQWKKAVFELAIEQS